MVLLKEAHSNTIETKQKPTDDSQVGRCFQLMNLISGGIAAGIVRSDTSNHKISLPVTTRHYVVPVQLRYS